MRNSLLILRGFAHDPHSILAAIYQSALVGIELCCNVSRRQSGVIFAGQENGVAMLTNASHWESRSYDPQLPFWRTASRHSASLRHFGVSSLQSVEIKQHHDRNCLQLDKTTTTEHNAQHLSGRALPPLYARNGRCALRLLA